MTNEFHLFSAMPSDGTLKDEARIPESLTNDARKCKYTTTV